MRILILWCFITGIVAAQPAAPQKRLLLFVETAHCQWCHKMRREIFDDPKTMRKLQQSYIVIRIQKESGNLPDFIQPAYYPTTYLFSTDPFVLIDSLPGYRTKEKFLRFFDITP